MAENRFKNDEFEDIFIKHDENRICGFYGNQR